MWFYQVLCFGVSQLPLRRGPRLWSHLKARPGPDALPSSLMWLLAVPQGLLSAAALGCRPTWPSNSWLRKASTTGVCGKWHPINFAMSHWLEASHRSWPHLGGGDHMFRDPDLPAGITRRSGSLEASKSLSTCQTPPTNSGLCKGSCVDESGPST